MMELPGQRRRMEMPFLQHYAIQWHGMALFGLLAVIQQIRSHILMMELIGQLQRVEVLFLQHLLMQSPLGAHYPMSAQCQ